MEDPLMSNYSWEEHTEALTYILLRLQRELRAVTEERDRLLKERNALIEKHERLLDKTPITDPLERLWIPDDEDHK